MAVHGNCISQPSVTLHPNVCFFSKELNKYSHKSQDNKTKTPAADDEDEPLDTSVAVKRSVFFGEGEFQAMVLRPRLYVLRGCRGGFLVASHLLAAFALQ